MTKLAAASSFVPNRLIKKVSTKPKNIIEAIARIMGAVRRTSNGTMGSETIFFVRWAALSLIFCSLQINNDALTGVQSVSSRIWPSNLYN